MKFMIFLIVTKDNPDVNWKHHDSILREEAQTVWNLQKNNIIRNIWFTVAKRDAVLILEEESEERVRGIINELPLIKNNLILYELIELTAYDGYERLFANKEGF